MLVLKFFANFFKFLLESSQSKELRSLFMHLGIHISGPINNTINLSMHMYLIDYPDYSNAIINCNLHKFQETISLLSVTL